ncbi:hypothetical protein BG015_011376 [Linnemannia schmuckeri]|uniref:F-box domain-containing protein n=1 Tax=Linnemannia schmuckeri TaxID=64567 RepID=A0A9P5V8J3_9FUNG|nr:hypothetical protein BG015_011376 [Linnemannia schmuckeri]
MNKTSIINLPLEIHDMIATLLTYNDLALCTRVSQAWNTIFNPIVWKHVGDYSVPKVSVCQVHCCWFPKARNPSNTQEQDPFDMEEQVSLGAGEQQHISDTEEVQDPTDADIEEQDPVADEQEASSIEEQDFCAAEEENGQREECENRTWAGKFMQCINRGALKKHGHHVQSLRLQSETISLRMILENGPPTFPQLTSVCIDGMYDGEVEENVVDFLNRCSAGLKEFAYHPREKDILASSYLDFRDLAVEALIKHAATLEIFRLDGNYACYEEEINRMLCSLPNLKVFYIGTSREDMRGGRLCAKEMVNSEWVCDNLEVFGCGIKGIPRPDIKPANKYVRAGTAEESLELHHQVYAKLGKLTKLRELTLRSRVIRPAYWGPPPKVDIYRQYDCLAMTLESGLDLLKDLKDLERVVFYDAEIGLHKRAQQKWVIENWPKADIRCSQYIPDYEEEETEGELA